MYARTTHIGFRSAAQLYVGSTGQTVHRRELARRRKLIQSSRDRIAYYEPALKIWHHQGNFLPRHLHRFAASFRYRTQDGPGVVIDSELPAHLNAPWVGQLLSRL